MKRLKITISLLLILSFLMSAMPTLAADAGEITTEGIAVELVSRGECAIFSCPPMRIGSTMNPASTPSP